MFDTREMLHSAVLANRLSPDLLERVGVSTLTGQTQVADADGLPVPEALTGLFPEGALRRGSTVTVSGSSSLILALVAETSKRPGWCAEVGSPLLGSAAAAQAGVVLDRFVRVARPGEQWASVVASLLEAFDLVVVHPPARAGQGDMRRLTARARERSAVLLVAGAWECAMINISVTRQRWQGLGAGHGYLRAREVEVQALGRGAAARPRVTRVWLPGIDGAVVPAHESAA
jgi:nucleotide-binding universal stress UspA family protein